MPYYLMHQSSEEEGMFKALIYSVRVCVSGLVPYYLRHQCSEGEGMFKRLIV